MATHLVRPNRSAVWSSHCIDLKNRLEDVQRRLTKKLNVLANLPYAKRLEILGLDVLLTRRIRSDLYSPLLQCCSWTQLHETCSLFVSRSTNITNITRGHNLNLFKPQCSLDVRKYSFAHRVIDIWNSLSSDIVNASNISVCKHQLEFVDFTPFVWWSLFRPVCFIISLLCYFLLLGMRQCLSGPVCPLSRLLFT